MTHAVPGNISDFGSVSSSSLYVHVSVFAPAVDSPGAHFLVLTASGGEWKVGLLFFEITLSHS